MCILGLMSAVNKLATKSPPFYNTRQRVTGSSPESEQARYETVYICLVSKWTSKGQLYKQPQNSRGWRNVACNLAPFRLVGDNPCSYSMAACSRPSWSNRRQAIILSALPKWMGSLVDHVGPLMALRLRRSRQRGFGSMGTYHLG